MGVDPTFWPLLASGVCLGVNFLLVLLLLAIVPHLLRQWQAGQGRTRTLHPYSIDRVAAEDAPDVTQRELRRGATLVHVSSPLPGIVNLKFVMEE